MKRTIPILVSLLVLLSVVGFAPVAAATETTAQGQCEFPYTATDATGTEVTLEERPERVTTTNPSAAQTMWEIGGKSQVVGLSQYALYLDGAEERENVSASGFGVSVEKVVATEPDLVLVPNATGPDTVEALRDAGLTVYHFPQATTVEDVREKTTRIGELTGNCEGAAETNAWMDANVEAVGSATADAERTQLLYPLGGGYVAGGATFINDILETAGGENLAAQEGDGYFVMNDETVLELDPDVIVVTQTNAFVMNEEPYASTTAGQQNATAEVDVNYLNQPGPRSVVYSVHNLTAQLHPDAYGEDDYVTREEAAASISQQSTETESADPTPSETVAEPSPTDETTGTPGGENGDDGVPGFGVGAAAVALLASALLALRRE